MACICNDFGSSTVQSAFFCILRNEEIACAKKNDQKIQFLPKINKKPIPKLSDGTDEDKEIFGHLMLLAGKIAKDLDLDDTFRLVVNNGAKAGQSVFHLHLHLLSGRPLSWPPG